MTEIWFVSSGRVYDKFINRAFQHQEIIIKELSEEQFADSFHDFTLRNVLLLNIIIDVNCCSSIHHISKFLNKRRTVSRKCEVRLILLSDFVTWGGKNYISHISDFEAEFKERRPLACAYDQFCCENILVRAAIESHIDLCVVCYGIIYGDAGLDVENIISYLWGREASQQCSDEFRLACNPTSVVPLTYIGSLTNQLVDLTLCHDKWPTVVAVIDKPSSGLARPFLDTIKALDVHLNGSQTPGSEDTSSSTKSAIRAADEVTCNIRQALWTCNIPIAESASATASSINGITFSVEGFGPVWAEFLAAKALDPVSVLVAGPPRSGKTELARHIAEILQVELITIESAVKFAFSFDAQEPSNQDQDEKEPQMFSHLRAIQAELRTAVETKANEGKKPAKGATAAPADGEMTEDAFTPALCQSLSIEVLRKCVSVQVQLHPRSRRRGFVLDVWDGKHFLAGAASLADALTALQFSDQPLQHVQLVVELHCRASLPVDRLLAAQGAQAKAKESQAAVKALEGIVIAYNADLVPLPLSSPSSIAEDKEASSSSDSADHHMRLGHKGVLEMVMSAPPCGEGGIGCAASAMAVVVSRIDISAAAPPTWEEAAASAVQTLLTARGGRIGWLSALPFMSESNVASTVIGFDEALSNADAAQPATVVSPTDDALPLRGGGSGIDDQLKELDAVKLLTLTQKADKLQQFLSSTVLPQLAETLVRIQREQPADPILFLAEQLARCSAEKNRLAQDRAHARFTELLLQQGEY